MYIIHTPKSKSSKKVKYRSAEDKRRALELERSWQSIKNSHATPKVKSTTQSIRLPSQQTMHIRDTGPLPVSLNSYVTGPVSSKRTQQYTGDKIIGIGTLHKSNAVPVFSENEAKEQASMRR